MTYDDIIDWTDDTLPMDLYDDAEDWIHDIEANFAKSGHYFPTEVVTTLLDAWNETHEQEDIVSDRDIRELQKEAKPRTEFLEKQFLKQELAVKQRKQEARLLGRKLTKSGQSKKMTKSERKKKRGIGR